MKKYSFHLMVTVCSVYLIGLFLLLAIPGKGYAQDVSVNGVVIDSADNSPLAGATVSVVETQKSTRTGSDGRFSIAARVGNTVVFEHVGFEKKILTISSEGTIEIALTRSNQTMDQVIVIGYGKQAKSDMTGAVGSVSQQQLNERPSASINEMLAGRVSGLQVNTNSGRPGGNTTVRLRGFGSINTSNSPLYVVDGVIFQNIDYINAQDIASVEVLKDASATAIYGARGANGVILITTERGNDRGSSVNYNINMSIPTMGPIKPEYLNAEEFLTVEEIAYRNIEKYDPDGWASGKYVFRDPALARTNPLLFDADGNPLYNTDWLKEATQQKLSLNQELSFKGGDGRRSYYVSLGHREDNGLILTSYLKRYNGRITFDDQVKKWLKVGGTLLYSSQSENRVDQDYWPIRMIAEALPFLPVKYPDGSWSANRDYPNAETILNPIHYMQDRKYQMNTVTVLGNIFTKIDFTKDLEMNTSFGFNNVDQEINSYAGKSLSRDGENGVASVRNNKTTFWSLDNYLTYTRQINTVHRLTVLAGLSWQESKSFGIGANAMNYPTDYFSYNNIGVGNRNSGYNSNASRFSYNSYFGRVNYSLLNKYLFTLTGRMDGSSKFGNDSKYAFFPSAAAAWKVSEEDFLKNHSTISRLKLRVSYGLVGNSEIPPYRSLSVLNSGYIAVINDQRVNGTGVGRLANPALKWETTAQADIGIELGLLNNRIIMEADWYHRKTMDMLLDAPVPRSSGYSTIRTNIGSMQNKGFELALSTLNVETRLFSWRTRFNISMNRNKVLKLATPSDIIGVGGVVFINPTNIIREGEPVGSFYGLVREGVWSEAEREEAAKFVSYRGGHTILPGDTKYRDVNGDYAITDADRMIIGNGSPKAWGALINSFQFGQWNLGIELQYSYGNDVFDLSTFPSEDRVALANSYRRVLDAWTPENQSSIIPELRDTRAGYSANEDTHWIKDGSFVRGRNLSLSYSFGDELVRKLKLKDLRTYASVQNFFMIASNDLNTDPETVGTGFGEGAFSQGVAYHAYPRPTIYMIGLNLSF